jgi:hypothetical protein
LAAELGISDLLPDGPRAMPDLAGAVGRPGFEAHAGLRLTRVVETGAPAAVIEGRLDRTA